MSAASRSAADRRLVGIDLGGTAIKAGALRADGEVLAERQVDTPDEGGVEAVAAAIAGLARELGAEGGLGVGVAGLIDAAAGRVVTSPNLPEFEDAPLRDALAAELGWDAASIRLENDANAAAYGEQWLGAGRDEPDVLFATLGTGIGGGLILGGRLVHGVAFASEFGHVVIEPRGEPCGCGSRGCVEQYASATAARRRATALGLPEGEPGNLELLTRRAREGAPAEAQLLFKIGRDLGRAFAVVVTLLDVRSLVVGGGFSAALDCMEIGVRAGAEERSFVARRQEIRVRRAELANRAGWIGAARLLLED